VQLQQEAACPWGALAWRRTWRSAADWGSGGLKTPAESPGSVAAGLLGGPCQWATCTHCKRAHGGPSFQAGGSVWAQRGCATCTKCMCTWGSSQAGRPFWRVMAGELYAHAPQAHMWQASIPHLHTAHWRMCAWPQEHTYTFIITHIHATLVQRRCWVDTAACTPCRRACKSLCFVNYCAWSAFVP